MKALYHWHFWLNSHYWETGIGNTEKEAYENAVKSRKILHPSQPHFRYTHAEKGNEVSEWYYNRLKEREEKDKKIDAFIKQLPSGTTFFQACYQAALMGISENDLAGKWFYTSTVPV